MRQVPGEPPASAAGGIRGRGVVFTYTWRDAAGWQYFRKAGDVAGREPLRPQLSRVSAQTDGDPFGDVVAQPVPTQHPVERGSGPASGPGPRR